MEAYFYPQAAVKMSPDGQEPPLLIEAPPKPSTSRNAVSHSTGLLWAIPVILIAVAVYASHLHSMMGLIEKENAVLKEASLVTPDPVTTTVFSTYTATTTSVSTATTTLTVGNKWFFAVDSSVPPEPSETHLPWESIDEPPPSHTSMPSATPSPKRSPTRDGALEPPKNPSPWSSVHLPSSKEMTEHLRWAIVKLWKVVLKAYHYPVDPP